MDRKNLLVTTLGMSWQIVPELFGFTNPSDYDFFQGNDEVATLRRKHGIEPVDELWVITVEEQRDLVKLRDWAGFWRVNLRIFICSGIQEFSRSAEIETMRSFIYRVVLRAREEATGKLYLSLTGGRKTMSADMQEAANLFGCAAMLHVVDIATITSEVRNDDLLGQPGVYAQLYMPVVVSDAVAPSLVVAAGERRLSSADFPLPDAVAASRSGDVYNEDGKLGEEIARRKSQSSQLYVNFYQSLTGDGATDSPPAIKRDVFRQLHFLHPDILRGLRRKPVTLDAVQAWPKAELHSHLGGVLSAEEIIEVASLLVETEFPVDTDWLRNVKDCVAAEDLNGLNRIKSEIFARKDNDFPAFYAELIAFVRTFSSAPHLLTRLVYGKYLDARQCRAIGIDAYQHLGDFQGSSLLQTRQAIYAAVKIYAENLRRDNVRYVELRCSPYKYTRLELSENDVVETIMDALGCYNGTLDYRLIVIIGRQSRDIAIDAAIQNTLRLLGENRRFTGKLAGIDLAGAEYARSPRELRKQFMPFLEKCVRVTVHAGETEAVENIWEAVYHLSADRIGHGLRLREQQELLDRFVDKGIGVELCPSSNDQIVGFGGERTAYPLRAYMDAGLKISLNTDNAGISRTTLSGEFMKAAELCCDAEPDGGLTLWDCLTLIRNSIVTSFLDTGNRKKLLRRFEDEIYKWCLDHEEELRA